MAFPETTGRAVRQRKASEAQKEYLQEMGRTRKNVGEVSKEANWKEGKGKRGGNVGRKSKRVKRSKRMKEGMGMNRMKMKRATTKKTTDNKIS